MPPSLRFNIKHLNCKCAKRESKQIISFLLLLLSCAGVRWAQKNTPAQFNCCRRFKVIKDFRNDNRTQLVIKYGDIKCKMNLLYGWNRYLRSAVSVTLLTPRIFIIILILVHFVLSVSPSLSVNAKNSHILRVAMNVFTFI